MEYHPEKDCVVVGGWDGVLKVYDLTSLERKAILRGHGASSSIQAIRLTRDARRIFSCNLDGFVRVFDSQIGDEVTSFRVVPSSSAGSAALALDLDERDDDDVRAVVGCRDGTVRTWALNTGAEPVGVIDTKGLSVRPHNKQDDEEEEEEEGLSFDFDRVTSVAFLPTNEDLQRGIPVAVGYDSGCLRIIILEREGDSLSAASKQSGLAVAVGTGEGEGIVSITPLRWEIAQEFDSLPLLWDDDDQESPWVEKDSPGAGGAYSRLGLLVITARGEAFAVSYCPEKSELSVASKMMAGLPPRSRVTAVARGVVERPHEGVCKRTMLLCTDRKFAAFFPAMLPREAEEGRGERMRPLDLVQTRERAGWSDADVHQSGGMVLTCDAESGTLRIWKVGRRSKLVQLAERTISEREEGEDEVLEQLEDYRPTAVAFTKVGEMDFCVAASEESAAIVICRVKKAARADGDQMEIDGEEDEDGEEEFRILPKLRRETPRGPVLKVRASEKRDFFCCHHSGGGVSVWSSKGLELRFVPSPGDGLAASSNAAFGGDTFLLVTDGGSKVLVYNAFKSRQVSRLVGHRGAVTAVVTAPSARKETSLTCYSAARDGDLRMSDMDSAPPSAGPAVCLSDRVVSVATLPEEQLVVAVSADCVVCVFRLERASCGLLRREKLRLKMLRDSAGRRSGGERMVAARTEWCAAERSILVLSVSSLGRMHVHQVRMDGKKSRTTEAVFFTVLSHPAVSLTTWRALEDRRKVSVLIGMLSWTSSAMVTRRFQFYPLHFCQGETKEKRLLSLRDTDRNVLQDGTISYLRKYMEGVPVSATFSGCALPDAQDGGSTWYSCSVSVGRTLFLGDTSGRITILPPGGREGGDSLTLNAHSGKVTAMETADEEKLLFTASEDCSIKAWLLVLGASEGDDAAATKPKIVQVGQFTGKLPFTSLSAPSVAGGEVLLAAGDSAGGIHLLAAGGRMLRANQEEAEEVPLKKKRVSIKRS